MKGLNYYHYPIKKPLTTLECSSYGDSIKLHYSIVQIKSIGYNFVPENNRNNKIILK